MSILQSHTNFFFIFKLCWISTVVLFTQEKWWSSSLQTAVVPFYQFTNLKLKEKKLSGQFPMWLLLWWLCSREKHERWRQVVELVRFQNSQTVMVNWGLALVPKRRRWIPPRESSVLEANIDGHVPDSVGSGSEQEANDMDMEMEMRLSNITEESISSSFVND